MTQLYRWDNPQKTMGMRVDIVTEIKHSFCNLVISITLAIRKYLRIPISSPIHPNISRHQLLHRHHNNNRSSRRAILVNQFFISLSYPTPRYCLLFCCMLLVIHSSIHYLLFALHYRVSILQNNAK